jgi:hypothetical protein
MVDFSNSMADGNTPSDMGGPSGELKIQNQTADSPPSAPWAGDDERPIQDNGTGGHNTYTMGQPSGNSFPPIPDPHADYGEANSTEISDFGLRETVEVGANASIANYGLEGPAAGGDSNSKNNDTRG